MRALGSELAEEVDTYCAAHGLTRAQFAKAAGMDADTVRGIGTRAYPTRRVVKAVRAFIAGEAVENVGGGIYSGAGGLALAHRNSLATPATVVDPEVAAASDRAPRRRVTEPYRAQLRRASASEALATALVETPADLIATVQRQWPDQWRRVVERARAAGTLPGAMLAQVIERGLEAGV